MFTSGIFAAIISFLAVAYKVYSAIRGKDPEAQQVKADIENSRRIRDEVNNMQKPVGSQKDIIDNLP